MSSLTTLARPYAKAAFELALGDEALARWEQMLELAGDVVSEPSIADLLDNPLISGGAVVKILTDAAGDAFDSRFADYLAVLAANDRLTLLPAIKTLYAELRAEAERRLRVRVVSAVPLDDDQAERMRAALARRFDREIELQSEIDPAVIGGAVVYAGDQVIDGSLRGRLMKLSNSLSN
ncbi:MAG: F0F1 ATP synthase subunit delta [Xanthomonadales bacterium]|nr:F0F1 ATP synthase subunit delta [Xanthomonadales bacterium]